MHIILSILAILFTLFIAILAFAAKIVGSILGFGKRTMKKSRSYSQNGRQDSSSRQQNANGRQENFKNNSRKKKVFDNNEGEYVEFEEIKD